MSSCGLGGERIGSRLWAVVAAGLAVVAAMVTTASAEPSLALRIVPEPRVVVPRSSAGFAFGSRTRIILPPTPTSGDLLAAGQIRARIGAWTGLCVPMIRYRRGLDLTGSIVLGQMTTNRRFDNPAVAKLLGFWPESSRRAPRSEGSVLGIGRSSMVICGFDHAGTFYACQTILQMIDQTKGGPLPSVFIYDYPELKWRGAMLRLWSFPGGYDRDFTREFISEVVARYKLNVLEPEIRLGMRYDSAPGLRYDPTAISKPQMADLVATMKRYHIKVVPAGVSPTHVDQWITDTPAYRGLAITPGGADLDIDKPETQAFLRGIIDEQIEVCHPEALHIGGDESTGAMDADRYLRTIGWLYDYVTSRGIRAVIWADVVKRENLVDAVRKRMPGIILQDWDYTSSKTDYPSLGAWTSAGLESWACPYGVYESPAAPGPWNIRYSALSAAKYGSTGLVAFNKARLGARRGTLTNAGSMTDLSMFPYYAEWAWNPRKPAVDPRPTHRLPFEGKEMLLRQIAPDRPTAPSAAAQGGAIRIAWTAPDSPNCVGVRIVYRRERFPRDPLDGQVLADVGCLSNEIGAYLHSGLCYNGKAYYGLFAYDALRHFSPTACVAVGVRPTSPAAAQR